MTATVVQPGRDLTGGRLLARNTLWSLLGQTLPMVVGVIAIPALVRGLGVDRFGLLSLAWIVIGYFSLFDLGIGRALTKLVADRLGARELESVPALAWTGLLLLLCMGAVGCVVALSSSPLLVHRVLKVPFQLQREALTSFFLLAFSIPIVTVTSGLRGILEAQQQFFAVNLIRVPTSVFSFVAPLLVLPFSHSLVPVVAVLIAGRLVGGMAHLAVCLRSLPELRHRVIIDVSIISPVIKFGGWMTVANVIGLFMLYMDRLLIGTLISVTAVAHYTAPFDVVNRLTVFPGAVVAVLFPAFTVALAGEHGRAGLLLSRGIKYVFLGLFPLVLAIVTFAPEGMILWLGPSFAASGSSVLRWITAGVFVVSLSTIPFSLIQSAGKPDVTAKLQMLELPLYLVALWLLTKRMGIEGTAIAWVARATVDAACLFFYAHRLFAGTAKFFLKLTSACVGALLMLYLGSLPVTILGKSIFLAIVLSAFAWASWALALEPAERHFLRQSRRSAVRI